MQRAKTNARIPGTTPPTSRRFAGLGGAGVALAFAGLAAAAGDVAGKGEDPLRITEVSQASGNIVYWVLPGPRVLGEATFGTPDNPKALFAPKLEAARQAKGPPAAPDTLKRNPILVGVPQRARSVTEDGTYILDQPTPFSDKARIVSGRFETVMRDVVREDTPGKPGNTPDTARFEAEFTDPAGNDYRVVLDHVVKPPMPGYRTQGGVFTEDFMHGSTGTGTPLMPRQYVFGAWWGLGELYINGEQVDDQRLMHLMTTEVVRNRDYELVHSEDLPLGPKERHIHDQAHHTHLMMPPIRGVPGKGPVFDPVPTAFELPSGKHQPFLHIMFEQDELTSREPSSS
jgi:hypothetical protein